MAKVLKHGTFLFIFCCLTNSYAMQKNLAQKDEQELRLELFKAINSMESLDRVKLIINEGCGRFQNFLIKDVSPSGQSSLQLAASKGRLDVVKELLRHGIYVDAADMINETPLFHAIDKNHYIIVAELLEHGGGSFKDNLSDFFTKLALNNAEKDGGKLLKLLVQFGIQLPAYDYDSCKKFDALLIFKVRPLLTLFIKKYIQKTPNNLEITHFTQLSSADIQDTFLFLCGQSDDCIDQLQKALKRKLLPEIQSPVIEQGFRIALFRGKLKNCDQLFDRIDYKNEIIHNLFNVVNTSALKYVDKSSAKYITMKEFVRRFLFKSLMFPITKTYQFYPQRLPNEIKKLVINYVGS